MEERPSAEMGKRARRHLRLVVVYGGLVLLLAGFGAGRFWEAGRGIVSVAAALRHRVAAAQTAQRDFRASLRTDSPWPRVDPALPPHRVGFYPPLARRRHEQGDVILTLLVLPNGLVGDAKVLRSSGSAQLDAAALVGAGTWVYLPAVKGHKPVAAWTKVRITFRIDS